MKLPGTTPQRPRAGYRLLALASGLIACCANAASVTLPPNGHRSLPLDLIDGGRSHGASSVQVQGVYRGDVPSGLSFPTMDHLFDPGAPLLNQSTNGIRNREGEERTSPANANRSGRGEGAAGQPATPLARRGGESGAKYPTTGLEGPAQAQALVAGEGSPADPRSQNPVQRWLVGKVPPRFSATLWLIGIGMIGLALIARRRSHAQDGGQAG